MQAESPISASHPCSALFSYVTLFMHHSKTGKPAHFKSQFHKKQVILGLLALLGNVPDAAMPQQLANGLPQLLSGLMRLLLDLKEQQEAAVEASGSDDDDDEGPVSWLEMVWCKAFCSNSRCS